MRYIGESQLAKDLVTKDYVDNKVANLASKDDIVHKSDLTAYATKDELKGIELTPGPKGNDGVGITNTTIRYAVGTTGTTAPKYADWFASPPSVPEGMFLWTEVVWNYSDKTTKTAYSVTKMGGQGSKGEPGPAGKDAVLNVQVVPFAPSSQEPGTIYLVRGV